MILDEIRSMQKRQDEQEHKLQKKTAEIQGNESVVIWLRFS